MGQEGGWDPVHVLDAAVHPVEDVTGMSTGACKAEREASGSREQDGVQRQGKRLDVVTSAGFIAWENKRILMEVEKDLSGGGKKKALRRLQFAEGFIKKYIDNLLLAWRMAE